MCVPHNYRVKVDNVRSIDEATSLCSAGADIISARPEVLSGFGSVDSILDRLCVCFDLTKCSEQSCVDFLQQSPEFNYVEFAGHILPSRQFVSNVISGRSQIIFSQINADHDTDPSWILSRHLEEAYDVDCVYQLLLACDIANGWNWLMRDADEETLQNSDIDRISRTYRTMITVDFTPNNVKEIVEALPTVEGFALPVQPAASSGPSFSIEDITTIIRRLRQ